MLYFHLGRLSALNNNIEGMYFEQISRSKVINIIVICIIIFSIKWRNVSDDKVLEHLVRCVADGLD